MVSYYNPLSYTQCANLYPMSNSWYSAAAAANYQQNSNASSASFFGGAAAAAGNGVPPHHHSHHQSNSTSNGGFGGGGGGSNAPGSGGGGSPDSEGQQSPMYYQHYQHAMFQQSSNSPEWQAMDRSGSPPATAINGSVRQNRMFQYPSFGGSTGAGAQQSHGKMIGATDLRTTNLSLDKLGNPHLTALPSPPISSPGGNCQNIKQGEFSP